MFDIGFTEILVIAVISLFVLGPERLPGAVRTSALWIGRFKRSLRDVRRELELQIGADDIRRELHNEEVMKNLQNMQRDVNKTLNERINLDEDEDFYPPGHHNHDPNNDFDENGIPIAAPASATTRAAAVSENAGTGEASKANPQTSAPAQEQSSDEQSSREQPTQEHAKASENSIAPTSSNDSSLNDDAVPTNAAATSADSTHKP